MEHIKFTETQLDLANELEEVRDIMFDANQKMLLIYESRVVPNWYCDLIDVSYRYARELFTALISSLHFENLDNDMLCDEWIDNKEWQDTKLIDYINKEVLLIMSEFDLEKFKVDNLEIADNIYATRLLEIFQFLNNIIITTENGSDVKIIVNKIIHGDYHAKQALDFWQELGYDTTNK